MSSFGSLGRIYAVIVVDPGLHAPELERPQQELRDRWSYAV